MIFYGAPMKVINYKWIKYWCLNGLPRILTGMCKKLSSIVSGWFDKNGNFCFRNKAEVSRQAKGKPLLK